MRRSAAPSFQSGGPGKRIKFSSPLLSNNKKCSPTPLPLRDLNDVAKFISDGEGRNDILSDVDKENIITCGAELNPHFEPDKIDDKLSDFGYSFQIPVKKLSKVTKFVQVKKNVPSMKSMGIQVVNSSKDNQRINDIEVRYFNAMWTKFSKKKHKTWEGDGILIISNTSIELRDQDNKVIAKKSQCKSLELQNLIDGSSMLVGGKEILVDGEISKEIYSSGKCFVSASVQKSATLDHNKTNPKGFLCPQKNKVPFLKSQTLPSRAKPRHDPRTPNAVVLEPESTGRVAVVLDPYLADRMRQHQIEGVQFVYKCVMGLGGNGNGVVLADDMGLGKTLQTIAVIWTLLKQGPNGTPVCKKCLIVTPSSLVMNWKQEFKKWLGDERIKVWALSAGESHVEDFIKSPLHSVLVISYEMFRKSVENILQINWGLIVCDEGHRLKNMNAKIGEALCKLPCKRRVILTGTPVQNNLKEFYTLLNFVNPGILGTPAAFNNVFADPIQISQLPTATVTQQNIGKARSLELSKITSLFILRRTNKINERYLPPKEENVLFCKASPLLVERYSQLLDNTPFYNIDSSQILKLILTLKKMCNHPCLVPTEDDESRDSVRDVNVNDSTKLAAAAQLLKQHVSAGNKVVLVSNYTQTLDLLGYMCDGLNVQFHRLDGSTPQAKRQNSVNLFNSTYDKRKVFLLSSKAGGVGLNLIGGNILILYDIDWNPANDLQAMARVWRDGQKKSVTIYRLITTGTIEEKILQRQVRKSALSKCVVDMGDEQCSFTQSELKDIFSCNFSTTRSVTHDLLKCGCDGDYKPKELEEGTDIETGDVQPDETLGDDTPGVVKQGLMELMRWEHSYHPTQSELVSLVFSKHTNVNKR